MTAKEEGEASCGHVNGLLEQGQGGGGTPAANAEWPLESSGSWSTFSGLWGTFTRLEILKAWNFSVVKDMAKIKGGSCAVYFVQWEGYVTEGLLIL